jgi:hypothetical protein
VIIRELTKENENNGKKGNLKGEDSVIKSGKICCEYHNRLPAEVGQGGKGKKIILPLTGTPFPYI